MITHLPIKLFCKKCEANQTIKEAKHISIDNLNKKVFINDKAVSCKKCNSTLIVIEEKN